MMLRLRTASAALFMAGILGACTAPSQEFTPGGELWMEANPEFTGTHTPSNSTHKVLVGVVDAGLDYNAPSIRQHIHVFETPLSSGRSYGIGFDALGGDFFPSFKVINPKTHEEMSDDLMVREHGTHAAQLVTLNDPAIGLIPVRVFPLPLLPEDEARGATNDPLLPNLDLAYQAKIAHRSVEAIVKSVDFAVAHGASIINLSLGLNLEELEASDQASVLAQVGSTLSPKLENEWRNCLMVVAAGNEATVLERVSQSIPATLSAPDLLSVGALSDAKSVADYSNTGRFVDIYTRGSDINSVVPAEGGAAGSLQARKKLSGTSMASPIVAHAAAQVKTIDPSLTPRELRALLINTADLHEGSVRVLNILHARHRAKWLLSHPDARALWLTPPFFHSSAPKGH
jgi:subtilisin family serine protease